MKRLTLVCDLRPEHRRATGGFTLIEILVTILVLSILLGLAVPAFRSFMQNDQQWVQTNNLLLALNTARSDAIKSDLVAGAQVCRVVTAWGARTPRGIWGGSF